MDYEDQDVHYQPVSSKSQKTPTAVLSGPTRSFSGWAMVKMGKLSRPLRRYVIIRSSKLSICTTENLRSAMLTTVITGAQLTNTTTRFEYLIRANNHRIWVQWPSEREWRVSKAAFMFANRRVEDWYKLVPDRQLGKGRASEVFFAFHTATGDHVAVKVINKDKVKSTDREFAEKEVLIRMTIQHPCVVQTMDIFETPFDLFVVMELMGGGPLDRRLMKNGYPLDELEARIIMTRLFAALSHLHSMNIAHRNVKPQNIFLDFSDDMRWSQTAKLSDFSLACFVHDPDSSRQIVGTPEYLAPEASHMSRGADGQRQVSFGVEVDMWAAGVTLYNMLSMELPFEGDYPPEVFKKARSGKLHFGSAFSHVSPQAISLIKALLNVDRRKRPTADTVMLHPWFEEDDDYYEGTYDISLSRHEESESRYELLFRSAAFAVIAMNRMVLKTPGLNMHPSKKPTRRFQFNVPGVNIAPTEFHDANEKANRKSTTIMSRVSTSSTVKTRSSLGDSLSGPARLLSARMQRSDAQSDYFGRLERTESFGSTEKMGSVHRLMSDTAGLVSSEERHMRKWKRWVKRSGD